MRAVAEAIERGELDATIQTVVSSRPDAAGIAYAQEKGHPHAVIPHSTFPTREAFDAAVVNALRAANVEWVVLAGFMRVVTRVLLSAFEGRVINIHPSLLPAFPGLRAQHQALEHGVKVTGCTVHFVDSGVDTGRIIAQQALAILPGEDEASLSARLLELEHQTLIGALQSIAAGRVPALGLAPRSATP